jgi:hypothetical protein
MKTFYSELAVNPAYYAFGYSVYGELEEGDVLDDAYDKGFLPFVGAKEQPSAMLYLARGSRVVLKEHRENQYDRQARRRAEDAVGAPIIAALHPKEEFAITEEFVAFLMRYFSTKFGKDSMPEERLRAMLSSPFVTHISEYTAEGKPIGYILESHGKTFTHVWYLAYETRYARSHLGFYLFSTFVARAKELGKTYAYLGVTCGPWMRYKANFVPLQYFSGGEWVGDAKNTAIKKLLATDKFRLLPYNDMWREAHYSYYPSPYPYQGIRSELRFLYHLAEGAPRLFGSLLIVIALLLGYTVFSSLFGS